MRYIRIPLILVFVALLPACSDNQKPAENKQTAIQKELTPEEKFAKLKKDAESGEVKAQTTLGKMYEKGEVVPKDAVKAVEWYQKAAAQGYAEAQYNLGRMYDDKEGVPKDEAKALEWIQKAAAQGYADAQFTLSFAYQEGGFLGLTILHTFSGAMPNMAKRADLLQKAAAQGHDEALLYLSFAYAKGEGVPKNAAKSVELMEKSAAQGNIWAQGEIGRWYLEGERGVSLDLVRGYAWHILRASSDSADGVYRKSLVITERRLTPAQIAEGQRMASNWKKGDMLHNIAGGVNATPPTLGVTASKQGTGTGFFVNSSGQALTNHHVVDGCKEVRVAGQDSAIKVVTSDTVNDLALLQIQGKTNAATLTDEPAKLRQGEDVVVYGYPLNSILSSGGNLTPGTVSALSGLGNNSNQIQITAPIQPGSSGSPVLDKKGNIVGVVAMKLSDSKMAKATGQIGQNVNFAVNGQTVKAFLDANKVSYKTGGGFFSREKSNADIAEDARKWTVVLECWK